MFPLTVASTGPTRTLRSSPRPLIAVVALTMAAALVSCSASTPPPPSTSSSTATTTTSELQGPDETLGSSARHPSDSGTQSFHLTSSTYTVKGDKTDGPHTAACADGWYVRAAPGSSPYDPIVASAHLDVSNGSGNVHISSAEPVDYYGSRGGAFKSFKFSVRSWTPYTHTYTFSWWCDKLPSWWTSNPGQASTKQKANRSTSRVGDIQNMDLNALINNGASHLTLNNSGDSLQENNPIIGWPFTAGAINQKLYGVATSDDYDGLFAYSFWPYRPVMSSWVITADPGGNHALHIHKSSGGIPRGGLWATIRAGVQAPPNAPGAWDESTLLFNTDYGQCLTGAVDQGQALELAPCDTNDPNQYWTLKPFKAVGP